MNTLTELLASTGGKTAKFTTIGDTITGTIVSAEARQRTDMDTGKPAVWDNQDPQMQVVIVLGTNLRDPDDKDDDGNRAVYIKSWGPQMKALREAVKASGGTDLQAGGVFTASYVGDGEKPKPHMSAPKLFTYTYAAPSSTAGLLAPETPTAAPAPAAAPARPSPVATAKELITAGLTDDDIAAATGLPITAVIALRNTTAPY